jgi:hypothetical protein
MDPLAYGAQLDLASMFYQSFLLQAQMAQASAMPAFSADCTREVPIQYYSHDHEKKCNRAGVQCLLRSLQRATAEYGFAIKVEFVGKRLFLRVIEEEELGKEESLRRLQQIQKALASCPSVFDYDSEDIDEENMSMKVRIDTDQDVPTCPSMKSRVPCTDKSCKLRHKFGRTLVTRVFIGNKKH